MKNDSPGMRFRLEANSLTREKVSTAVVQESGLECPDSFFVELDAYKLAYGEEPSEDMIVYEEVEPGSGVKKPGVSWFICIEILRFASDDNNNQYLLIIES